jgi:hypothetical protein
MVGVVEALSWRLVQVAWETVHDLKKFTKHTKQKNKNSAGRISH